MATLTRHVRLEQAPAGTGRRWSWSQYLAIIAIPIAVVQIWTLTAWLLDRPHQITEFREHGTLNWWACRFYEGLGLVLVAIVVPWVLRQCIRQRRLTFDAHFLLAGATIFWGDAAVNFFVPTFLYSSNFVNLNNPLGHMPFMVNPDMGRLPDPLLFSVPLETAGLLVAAIAMGALAKWFRQRYPGISTPKLIGLLVVVALAVEVLVELPIIAMGLWTYTSPPLMSVGLGGGHRYPFPALIAGTCFFMVPALLRLFKDDRGRTLIERGMDHYHPAKRGAVTFLALYATLQILVWGPATVPVLLYGPYQEEWPEYEEYLVNDVCDAPGIAGTRYGPCPGSPGFRMPGRTSDLVGEAP